MPKLIVHLSGVWPKDFSLSNDDKIYAPASMDRKRTHERAMTIDVISSICEASLCRKYANLYSKYQSYDSTGMIFCFLNDFYSYSLRPCFLLMHSILKLATDFPDHKLTIVSADTDCEILPMFGFQTTESMRGSQDLMGSLVAKRLKPFVDSKNGDFVYVKGDFLRINKIRKILIWFVNLVFFTLFIIKCLSLNLFIKKSKNTHDKLIICRNRHQSRFAKEVVDNVSDSAIFLIPQLAQGRFVELMNIKNMGGCGFRLNFGMIFKSFIESRKGKKALERDLVRLRGISRECIEVEGVGVDVDLSWIADEILRMSIFFFYKSILSEVVDYYKVKKLISFELVGRMAGIEALAAREKGIGSATVQTALISSRPHPVFPLSNYFFADSDITRSLIKDIGFFSLGEVKYVGPVCDVKSLKKVKRINRVVFYSQPYEINVTLKIINILCLWAQKNEGKIKLRLHPRDRSERYQAILREYSDIISFATNENLTDLFEWADLSITRTSSVAKESLSSGCPVMLCLWSDFDRNVDADYISRSLVNDYCSFGLHDFIDTVSSVEKIMISNHELHSRIFSGKTLSDLMVEVSDF